ncbi:hypothetical protein Q670_14365 [Alcanivorax sp. P2S70]|jgi:outer membrane protein OmpA-like peptidoglycan-associated protein|uniref:OmpA family protein n=1 Tax=Alcanivorax profundi TaxID=2338368 RepID=A0A418Y0B4_9GAMM|nr:MULTISPECIES: OmpA family protein [Alcanivorax]ERP90078.1 hypothetical protein Q670_14365 [Alcanivorax sp. P2S70]RJG18724.1 OmpA family protein [Alcanivorax profundi]
MRKSNVLAAVASCAALVLGGCAGKAPDDPWPGYRTDGKGQLLKTADGHCWRTADWTEDKAVPACDVAITGEPVVAVEGEASSRDAVAENVAPAPVRVTFAFDSAVLGEAARIALKAWYQAVAKLEGEVVVTVNGYSDPLGPAGYNRNLAEQRARAVARWWEEQGDSTAALQVEGHGEDAGVSGLHCQSVPADEMRACYQQDRRVELRIQ